MRANALTKYGSLEGFTVIALPLPEPGHHEVRVRVHASTLNPADYKVALGTVKFLHARNFPMVLGYDFSGVIESVGENVSWKINDEVFGFLPYGPFNRRGAFAEYLIANSNEIALKPSGVSHIQAAASATSGITAIQGIRDIGKLSIPGGRILITGVSGGVGSTAISVARELGATVVGIGSGRGLDIAKQLGASEVIDRKNQDVFASSQEPFDVIFDAASAYRWSQWKEKLKPGGMYVTTLPSLSFAADKLMSLAAQSGVGFVNVKGKASDLKLLASWLESGLNIPIDSTIPVREVAKGMAKLQEGNALGRIAVDVISGF